MDKKFIIIPSALIAVIKEKKVQGALSKQENQNFSELEQKIFLAMIYFAFEQKYLNPAQSNYDLHFGELRQLFKSLVGRSNDEFLQAINELSITNVLVADTLHKENKPFDKINNTFYEPFTIVTTFDPYDNGVHFTFPVQIESRLLKPKPFVKLPITELNAISGSKYTLPLYALIKDYENSPRRQTAKIGLDALWGILGVTTENADFTKLRDKVISRSLKSINSRTNLDVKISVQRRDRQAISVHFTINKKVNNEKVDVKDPLNCLSDAVLDALEARRRNKDYNYLLKMAEKYQNGDIRTVSNIEVQLIKNAGLTREKITEAIGTIKNYLVKIPLFFASNENQFLQFIDIKKEKAEYLLIDIDGSSSFVGMKQIYDIAYYIHTLDQSDLDARLAKLIGFVNDGLKIDNKGFGFYMFDNEDKKSLNPVSITREGRALKCLCQVEQSDEMITLGLKNDTMIDLIKKIRDRSAV